MRIATNALPRVEVAETQPVPSFRQKNGELAAGFARWLVARGLSKSTQRNYGAEVRNFLDFIGSDDVTQVDHLVIREFLHHLSARGCFLSEEEVGKLIEAAETPRDLALIEVAYATGCRVSELVKIRLEDIDCKGRTILVRQGKGNKDRYVLFGSKAAAAIRKYLAVCPHKGPYLFENAASPASPAKPLDARTVRAILASLSNRAGI